MRNDLLDLLPPGALADALPLLTTIEQSAHAWLASFGEPGEAVARLILAAVLGGLVGLEREIRGHEAGLRTFMLVAAGSALAMIVSTAFAGWSAATPATPAASLQIDPARVAYGVMTGVGFLGAGTILRRGSRVQGLTTAAGIWSVAALGLAVGFGLYVVSVLATLLTLGTLVVLSFVQPFLPVQHTRRVWVRLPREPECLDALRQFLRDHGMKTRRLTVARGGRQTVVADAQIQYFGSHRIEELTRALLTHPQWSLVKIRS